MQTKNSFLAGVLSLSIAIAGTSWAHADGSELRDTFKAAAKDLGQGIEANDSAAFQKLLTLLPKDDSDDTYIVEGDISVTPKELEEHLLGFAAAKPFRFVVLFVQSFHLQAFLH